jgi:Zn-finger protein
MVNIFKPKNLSKNMRKNEYPVGITCRYHNGRNGYHDPYSSGEGIVAMGKLDGKYLEIEYYTPLFEIHGFRCTNCPYAKIYLIINENGNKKIKERDGKGKIRINRIKILRKPIGYKEIEEKARNLGFPL